MDCDKLLPKENDQLKEWILNQETVLKGFEIRQKAVFIRSKRQDSLPTFKFNLAKLMAQKISELRRANFKLRNCQVLRRKL